MGRKCFVPDCRTGSPNNKEKFTIFAAPKQKELFQLWKTAMLRNGIQKELTQKHFVCSKHFTKEDIIDEWTDGKNTIKLKVIKYKETAVPSVCLGNGESDNTIKSERKKKKRLKVKIPDLSPTRSINRDNEVVMDIKTELIEPLELDNNGEIPSDELEITICKEELDYSGSAVSLWTDFKEHALSQTVQSESSSIGVVLGKRKAPNTEDTSSDSESNASSFAIASQDSDSSQMTTTENFDKIVELQSASEQSKMISFFLPKYINPQRQEIISSAIAKMLALDMLPTLMIEGKGFQQLMNVLEPNYKIQCRSTINKRINLLYEKEKTKVMKKFLTVQHVALTTECWSSRNNQSYITVTAHALSNEWEKINYVLSTEVMEETDTAENLKEKIEAIIIEWGLESKVVATVHDNAANICKAIQNSNKLGNSVSCFAHSLQLGVNKGLAHDKIKEITKKCSAIVSYFHHSNMAANGLSTAQEQLNLKKHKLIQSCCTRWNSTYQMYERLLEQKEALLAVIHDRDIKCKAKASSCQLTDMDWTLIEALIIILKPFELATTYMSTEIYPSLSAVHPVINSLVNNFLKIETDEQKTITEVKILIKTDLERRFLINENLCTHVISNLVSYLDPRFKMDSTCNKLLIKNYIESTEEILSVVGTETELEHKQESSAADILFPAEPGNNISESEQYALENEINKNMSPIEWWKINETRFPKIALLAKKFLCIPATSCPAETVFSDAGNIVSAKRNSLLPENVNKLVFLHHNLQL